MFTLIVKCEMCNACLFHKLFTLFVSEWVAPVSLPSAPTTLYLHPGQLSSRKSSLQEYRFASVMLNRLFYGDCLRRLHTTPWPSTFAAGPTCRCGSHTREAYGTSSAVQGGTTSIMLLCLLATGRPGTLKTTSGSLGRSTGSSETRECPCLCAIHVTT